MSDIHNKESLLEKKRSINNSTSIKNQIFPSSTNSDKLINFQSFQKMLKAKKETFQVSLSNENEIYSLVSNGLEQYLKNLIEELVKISRIRNINFENYSKYRDKTNNVSRFIYTYI